MEPKHPAPRWQEKGKWRALAAMRKAMAEILDLHLGMSNRTTSALAPGVTRVDQIVADDWVNGVFFRFGFVAIPSRPRASRVKKATVPGKFPAVQFRHKKHSKAALEHDDFRSIHSLVIASEAKQSSAAAPSWIASSLRSSQ